MLIRVTFVFRYKARNPKTPTFKMDQTQRGFSLEDKTEEEQLALALEASRATFKREASKFFA